MKEEYELYTGKNNVETYIKKYNSGCFLSSESYINHTINLYNGINNKSKIEIDIAFYQQIYCDLMCHQLTSCWPRTRRSCTINIGTGLHSITILQSA